jgi:hypothetical protein
VAVGSPEPRGLAAADAVMLLEPKVMTLDVNWTTTGTYKIESHLRQRYDR